MAEAKAKTEVTMKMTATCPHHARSDVSVRDVESVIDEPTERGGTNLGMTPTETMVAALIGCTNVITNKIAEGYGMHVDSMDIDVEAEFDKVKTDLQKFCPIAKVIRESGTVITENWSFTKS